MLLGLQLEYSKKLPFDPMERSLGNGEGVGEAMSVVEIVFSTLAWAFGGREPMTPFYPCLRPVFERR
jgi:hypothetical protein